MKRPWISRRTLARKQMNALGYQAYVYSPGKPVWSPRAYDQFAREAYARNVVAHRAVHLVATAAASVPWKLLHRSKNHSRLISEHPLLRLLDHPNPTQGGSELIERMIAFRLIAGNAYLHAIGANDGVPLELHVLRPDRVSVIAGRGGVPAGYRYTVGQEARDIYVDRLTGRSDILHLKAFHPLDDWYGLSPVEAAAYSIDQHNQASAWNQALLQNGARPSGALVVKGEGGAGYLSEDQYLRIKAQIEEQFSGAANAGRPLLLEGGLDWKELSLSPRDMDFLGAKHSAARDIALAFGVPPQLLGIPGDNTYSNYGEARLAFWEDTVMPLLDHLCDALNHWLVPRFGEGLRLQADMDAVPALAARREAVWQRAKDADFLTDEEKRRMVGLR